MAITIIVEDGTGLANANVYCDSAYLDSHAELLGEDLTAYTDEQKKSAIWVAANKYIDRLHEFKGAKVQPDQGMKLYTDLVTFAEAGDDIQQANAEAAILQLKGLLFVDPSTQDVNGKVIKTKDKLDVLEKEREYEEGTSIITKYNTSTIDALLKPYVLPSSSGVKLVVT